MIARFIPLLLLVASPAASFAQTLADRVPADSIVYVGWRGSDNLGPAYQGSHLKALSEGSQISELVNDFIPKALEKAGSSNPDVSRVGDLVRDLAAPLWHHPCAFYFTGIVNQQGRPPAPRMALIAQAGADAESLRKQLADLIEQAGEPPVPVHVAKEGELVALSVGYDNGEDALAVGPAGESQPLAKEGRFIKALAQVDPNAAMTVYVSGPRLLQLVEKLPGADPQFEKQWPKIRDGLGLNGLESFIWTDGFDGKDWGTRLFIAAPEPRTGLLAMMGGMPLTDDAIKTIPATATLAGGGFLNISGLVSRMCTAVGKFDPNAQQQFDQVLEQVNDTIGFDIQKDLLDSLGSEWMYYADPQLTGKGLLGVVLVNRLVNPQHASDSISKLEQIANQIIAANIPRQPRQPQMTVAFRQTRAGALTIHYLGVPLITPAWAIDKGILYVALYPQVVKAAAGQASQEKSILDNPAFVDIRQRLGGVKAESFQFVDLQRTAPDAYGSWLAISHVAGFGDLFGVPAPAMLLPPLPQLLAELSPAASVTWSDADGFHARSIEPFPASGLLASDPQSMASLQAPLMISILLPALNRAREQANRVKSASNLRQMGMAAMMYANEHDGRFPETFAEMIAKEDITAGAFANPRRGHDARSDIAGEKASAWVTQHSDYVWLGGGKKNATTGSDDVLAYEKPVGLSGGINILYGDGHVDFQLMSAAAAKIPGFTGADRPPGAQPKDGGL